MNEGDIALAPLPQADGQIKNRPVVLLRRLPPFGDFLVCGISTQLQQRVAGFDEEIAVGDPEFAATGLKAASLIRLGFLAVLPDAALLGRIGSLSSPRRLRLLAQSVPPSRFAGTDRLEEITSFSLTPRLTPGDPRQAAELQPFEQLDAFVWLRPVF